MMIRWIRNRVKRASIRSSSLELLTRCAWLRVHPCEGQIDGQEERQGGGLDSARPLSRVKV